MVENHEPTLKHLDYMYIYMCISFCRYHLDNLKFGKLDVSRYAAVAEE